MVKAFRLIFNLYPGEGRKAFLFTLLALFWGVGGFGLQILSEGVFVEHMGADSLPYSYLTVALALCVTSCLLIIGLKHWTVNKLFKILVAIWGFCYLFFYLWYTLATPSPFFWYGLKTLGWTAPVSLNVVFWSLSDRYFDLQDGKRFFALFNATVFTGDLVGSAIVSFGLKVFSFSIILLTFSTCLFICLPLTLLVGSKTIPLLEEGEEGPTAVSTTSWKEGLQTLSTSPFTLYLLATYLIMQVIAVNCEYHYMTCFEREFEGAGELKLTEFIGFCNIWISLGNMVLSLLLYSRLVQKIGLNNLVLIAPATFLSLFFVWLWAPWALPFAICGAVAREGVLYVLDDNNLNLLVSAVPHKIRNQIRISLESFFEPVGMLFTSCLLMALPHFELKIGMIFASIALPTSVLLRRYYPKALFENLMAASIQFGKKVSDWFPKSEKREVEFLLLSQLKNGDEKCQLLALKYLLQFENKRLLVPVLHHLELLSLMGKLDALELLCESPFAKHPKTLEKLERWRKTYPHEPIQLAILHYLAKLGLIRPEKIAHDLESSALSKCSVAILALKTSPFTQQFPSFEVKAQKRLETFLESPSLEEVLLGLSILGYVRTKETALKLIQFLQANSLEIARVSAQSLSQIASPEIKDLAQMIVKQLPLLQDPKTRVHLLHTLEKLENPKILYVLLSSTLHFLPHEKKIVERIALSYGIETVPTLVHLLENREQHERCRLLAGKILAQLQPSILKKRLKALVSEEVKRALFYYYHAQTVKQQLPDQDLSILEDALITGYHSTVDFMIQLIGAASQMDASEVLSMSLWSDNKKTAAQALEAIEKLTPPKLFSLIEPLLKPGSGHKRWMFFLKLGGTPMGISQLLDKMASSPSPTDQIVAIGMKAKMGDQSWRRLIQKRTATQEVLFKHFAAEMEQSTTPELTGMLS